MEELEQYFMSNARISRRALARFGEVSLASVDRIADDLGFGSHLRLDDAEQLLDGLEDDGEQDDGDDNLADDGDGQEDDEEP